MDYCLSHLGQLESESIYLFREVAEQFEKPAILFSGGKDSILMVHLAFRDKYYHDFISERLTDLYGKNYNFYRENLMRFNEAN